MYQESVGSRKTLGDVDVVYHDGVYHLFHLVLPNHDYIAHAVSSDCLRWRRVENALFIGHPGSWDDSMLWTVHVSPDPHNEGRWRMFYTGLSRRDKGKKQRIGLAISDNLFTWQKTAVHWQDERTELPFELPDRPEEPNFEYDADSSFPIGPSSQYYEDDVDEGRRWISWRDPFLYQDDTCNLLLCAARVSQGPIVRRGCVALLKETKANHFEAQAPLYYPSLYDDIEVPNLLKIEGDFYLIGSIREDAKIRYWRAANLDGPWQSPADNVLIGTGHYAGRTTQDEKGLLFWSFYSAEPFERSSKNLMPPPKRLVRKDNGDLALKTYEGFEELIIEKLSTEKPNALIDNKYASYAWREDASQGDTRQVEKSLVLNSPYQIQIFTFAQSVSCFRLKGHMAIQKGGKCGLVFRLNPESRDGYYLSLDLHKGLAQLRAWGTHPPEREGVMIHFSSLQQGYWKADKHCANGFELLVYGSYIELSINGYVILSLADRSFADGSVGFYVDSTEMTLTHLSLEALASPSQSDDHLATG